MGHIRKRKNIPTRRNRCNLEKSNFDIFFSLYDYQNNYFMSKDPNEIIRFYDSFKSKDNLIQWMRNRPNGAVYLHEVEGNKQIIAIVATSDYSGKFAQHCMDNIYKGLHIIFVESGDKPDDYFKISHNLNIGIRKALEYSPKWIIVSGDDMYKIDEPTILIEKLAYLDNNLYNVVFTEPSEYHSAHEKIAKRRKIFNIYYSLTNSHQGRATLRLFKKFDVNFTMSPTDGLYSKLFDKGYQYVELQDFAILSARWLKNKGEEFFDETFINAGEDTDLSLDLSLFPEKIAIISYRIGDMVGSTLGVGADRDMRHIAGLTYLNNKWKEFLNEKAS